MLRKIVFATKRQTFNEPGKLSFRLLVTFLFSSFFLNDGHNYGKKNVALKYAKICKKKKKKVSDELLFQLQSLPLQSQKTFDIIFLYCQVTYFF